MRGGAYEDERFRDSDGCLKGKVETGITSLGEIAAPSLGGMARNDMRDIPGGKNMRRAGIKVWSAILIFLVALAGPFKAYWGRLTGPGLLTRGPVSAGKVIEGAMFRGVAKFQYDFDIHGGVTGNIVLSGEPLPIKAIVWEGVVDVITALTGGAGATAAVSTAQAANDLITAADITGAPWSTTGLKALVPVGDAANGIKMTAERAPKLVIGTADLTAGKFNLFIEYYLSD